MLEVAGRSIQNVLPGVAIVDLMLKEKNVVTSVAIVLFDLYGPGEWMAMEKLHAREDPFVVSHNLGRVVDKFNIKVLREEFERATDVMQCDPNPWIMLFEPYVLG
ncbi:hypothetical protein PVK06_008938 [Gossypium arboreum]|uniref:Uncharacterized protein n=1 Tax=Gossypium arboreum TaxID=29729 RepID=A0ABR0QL62_GOSAR|nr:hypothetical protein PVK06_008938 [Gossypium arboreum]